MRVDRTEEVNGDTVYRVIITKLDSLLAKPSGLEQDEITRLSAVGSLSHFVAGLAIYMAIVERELRRGDVAQRKSGS